MDANANTPAMALAPGVCRNNGVNSSFTPDVEVHVDMSAALLVNMLSVVTAGVCGRMTDDMHS